MAISPDLLEVEQSLSEANQTLLDSYMDFRSRNGLTEERIGTLKALPPSERRIDLNFGTQTATYSIKHLGMAQSDAVFGFGIIIVQDDHLGYPPAIPEGIGIITKLNDYAVPLFLSYQWKITEADITGMSIAAVNSKVLQIMQRTRRNLLLRGPDLPSAELSPKESIDLSFVWRDKLFGWQSVFTLVEDEDALHFPISHLGPGTASGFLVNEYQLPEWINMPLVIGNILNKRPALLGAASY